MYSGDRGDDSGHDDPFNNSASGAGQAGEDDPQQDSGNQGGSGQQQIGQEAPLHPTNQGTEGSHGTDFSVHRLLPPPIAFAPQPMQDGNHSTTNHLAAEDQTHIHRTRHTMPQQGGYLDPLGPQRWVGYGNPCYSPLNYQGPGQRWPNHFCPPYPMPHPGANTNPPPFTDLSTTPSHHDTVATTRTSPDCNISPQPTDTNSMHLYHPANAGLYTLCEAAMMSSNLESSGAYTPETPQPLLMNIHPRPPPPYYYQYQEGAFHSPFHSRPTATDQTSPASPQPPVYLQIQPQTNEMMCNPEQPGPSFMNHIHSNGIVCDSERPGSSSYTSHHLPHNGGALGEEPGATFVNQVPTDGIVQDTEQPGPSYLNQLSHDEANAIEDTEQPDQPSFLNDVMQDVEQLPDDSAGQTEEELVASLAPTTTALPVQEEEGTEGELAIVIHVDNPAETPEPEPTPKKKKSKRMRTAFSLVQLDKLELAYHANPYPDGFFRQKVSQETGIPEDRIQVWFQNRRARGKKQARTGSISQRSIFRQNRLLANLARRAALVAAASAQGVCPQNINAATAYNIPNGGESHDSQMQQQGVGEDVLPNQPVPSTLPSPNPQPGPLLVSSQYQLQPMTASASINTADTISTSTAQSANSSAQLPPPSPGSAPVNMPPPLAYHHTAGRSTICYFPHPPANLPPPTTPHPEPSQENSPTPNLNLPVPHNNPAMYYFPPPPGHSLPPPGPSLPQPPPPGSPFLQPPPLGPSFPQLPPLGPPFFQPPAPSLPSSYHSGPILSHPYPPGPLPPILPPAGAGLSSSSSSSPSPSHTISPQITGMNPMTSRNVPLSESPPRAQGQSSVSPDQDQDT